MDVSRPGSLRRVAWLRFVFGVAEGGGSCPLRDSFRGSEFSHGFQAFRL